MAAGCTSSHGRKLVSVPRDIHKDPSRDECWFMNNILAESIFFFDQPVHFEPMFEAVFVATVV